MEILLAFGAGGVGYMGLELLWRRRTHWSMGLAGGVCAALLWALFTARPMPWWGAYLWGAAVITAVEFLTGLVVNRWLGLGVWDYSARRFQLYGQICLGFSLLWGLLGLAIWGVAQMTV